MNWTAFTPFVNTLGLVVLALAIFYSQWRAGAGQVSTQVLTNYETLTQQQKEQLEAKDKQIAQYQADMAEIKTKMTQMEKTNASEIGKLQGQLDSKDKQIADLTATVLNRNPQLEQILSEIRDFMKRLSKTNEKQTLMLETAAGIEHVD